MEARFIRRSAVGVSVLTANRLTDGRIVWRGGRGIWGEHLSDADPIDNAEIEPALTLARGAAQTDEVVGVYAVQLAEDGRPATARERIRAFGPSVHPEFATRDAHIPEETRP